MIVYYIPPDHCRAVWPRVKAHLEPAIEATGGRWKPEYVLAALVLGEQNLWAIVDEDGVNWGAAVTQIVTYPEKKMLAIHYLGGEEFDEWYPKLLDTLCDYAKRAGCSAIECNARFGFWKWFKNDGFEKTSCFYEKPL